jgi:cytochrome c-type biogenesis protein CcmH/NrfG
MSDERRANAALAADAYREASELDPHPADAHLRLGRVHVGDADGARQELAEAERITNRRGGRLS